MKLSLELLCAPLLVAVALAAPDASIYISGSPVDVPRHSLSPDATRLLLARRLGLSQYHSLEGAYESILKILNDFGGEQRALLPTEEQGLSHQRNLMVIDGVESPEGMVPPLPALSPLLMSRSRNYQVWISRSCPHDIESALLVTYATTSKRLVQTSSRCACRWSQTLQLRS